MGWKHHLERGEEHGEDCNESIVQTNVQCVVDPVSVLANGTAFIIEAIDTLKD